ncbi:MAG: replication initiator protein [Microviridae sp.]|nr:MAG: replication initiator protein [Microviridae sp.]
MCTRPMHAWYKAQSNDNGKFGITFKRSDANLDRELLLPCGKCLDCKRHHVNEWALRCVLEASQHEDSMFVTLTYNDANLPKFDESGHYGTTLRHKDFQDFMKRLRKHLDSYHDGKKVKYFMCGEYGGKTGRPHYHAIIFGHMFDDVFVHESRARFNIYRSPTLERLWNKGFSTIGECHYGTCAYVAKYSAKRFGGEDSHVGKKVSELEHYYKTDGEHRRMEYLRASQGIGKDFCLANADSILRTDKIPLRAYMHSTPRQFLNWLSVDYPVEVQAIKDKRMQVFADNAVYLARVREFVNRGTGELRVVPVLVKQPVDRYKLVVKEWKQLLEMGISHNFPHLNPKFFGDNVNVDN